MAAAASRSTRFLTGMSSLLLVVAIAFAAFLLVGAVFGFGPNGHEVGVHATVAADRLADLPSGAVAADDVDVLVRVQHATAEQVRWAAGRDLAPGILTIVGLWLLRQILVSVRAGDPFTAANVSRLRALAVLVLAGVPVARLVSSACASELARTAHLPGAHLDLGIPGAAFVAGLGAFALAEVFAGGLRLRDDLEGTV